MSEIEFIGGWLPSSPEKRNLHRTRYAMDIFFPIVQAGVEVDIPGDPQFVNWFDQDGMNACVGASWSKVMARLNLPQIGAKQYSWRELYRRACEIDGDRQTSYANDVGTYLWAGGDVLRRFGPFLNPEFRPEQGIESYYWAHSADDVRTALSKGRPCEFGIPWYSGFQPSNLVQKSGEWWIPPRSKWGNLLGGHAIELPTGSDQRQAGAFNNSWGGNYPAKVWISYDDINELLQNRNGECAVPMDLPWEPPAPEPNGHRVVEQFVLQEGGELFVAVSMPNPPQIEMEQVK